MFTQWQTQNFDLRFDKVCPRIFPRQNVRSNLNTRHRVGFWNLAQVSANVFDKNLLTLPKIPPYRVLTQIGQYLKDLDTTNIQL